MTHFALTHAPELFKAGITLLGVFVVKDLLRSMWSKHVQHRFVVKQPYSDMLLLLVIIIVVSLWNMNECSA